MRDLQIWGKRMRIALGVEYDGSAFYGWQSQPKLRTVQGCIEKAISKVANKEITIQCAGRTDTGVHALNQVIHFDTPVDRPVKAWLYGVNAQLPKDICIHWSAEVSDEFHARFSATSRSYRYVIYNHSVRPAVGRSCVTWHYRPLNSEKMHEAAQKLVGEQDFSSFRSSECQSNSPFRCIDSISVTRKGNYIIIDVKANAFLHHMVRNIAGVLMLIGNDRKDVEWVNHLLEVKSRTEGGETAPPYGLYLFDVGYPEGFSLPEKNTSHFINALFS